MAESKELRLVVNSLERFAGNVVKALVVEVHAMLVRAPSEGGTPVDTGFARANWVPSISVPFASVAGSQQAVSGATAQSGLALIATRYMLRDGPAFVSNNVKYIQRLNAGSSTQSPPAFVQKAIADAVRNVERSRLSAA